MRKLYLTGTDKKIFGICGSVAEIYELDPTTVRIVTVFVGMLTGIIPMLVTYFVAYKIMPKEPPA